ncbi:hypothetical protein [Pyrobaculum sp.]|uniref:hypothetical protein n=1 Tax=Pyrobaculum sp. TaxID=2004705 RepID=UPI003D0EAEB7
MSWLRAVLLAGFHWSAWLNERSLTPCVKESVVYKSDTASYACDGYEPVYIDAIPPASVARAVSERAAAFRRPLIYTLTVYKTPPFVPPARPGSRISPWTLPVAAALLSGAAELEGVWLCWWGVRDGRPPQAVCVVERSALRWLPRRVEDLAVAVGEAWEEKGLTSSASGEA